MIYRTQDIAPVHPDAIPLLPLDKAVRETWLAAQWEIAQDLKQPPPAGALRMVATDSKQDG
jgi:putative SOS response-associated peptidase YedK